MVFRGRGSGMIDAEGLNAAAPNRSVWEHDAERIGAGFALRWDASPLIC